MINISNLSIKKPIFSRGAILIYLGCFLGYLRLYLIKAKGTKDFFSCNAFVKDVESTFSRSVSAKVTYVLGDCVFGPGNYVDIGLFAINWLLLIAVLSMK